MKLLICTQAIDQNDQNLGFFHEWVAAFAQEFDRVLIFTLRVGEHALPANVEIVTIRNGKHSRLATAGRFISLVLKRRRDYDTVFVHMNPEYLLLTGFLWRCMRKPVTLWYTHKSVTPMLRIAECLSTRILSASHESFRLNSKKLVVLGHGIDAMHFSPPLTPPARTSFITVGRLSPTKRINLMLDAFCILHARGGTFDFTIVGGPATPQDYIYEEKLRTRIGKLPFAGQVHLVGPVSHRSLPSFLSGAHIFVNASTTGSLDKAVLESMAHGLIPVTSNEAFEEALPADLFVRSCAADDFAKAFEHAMAYEPGSFRAYVQKKHSLALLIPRVAAVLKEKAV